jgi:hypothetical protein
VERDKPKISKSVGQTFPQLPWKQKKGFNLFNFGGHFLFKMATIANQNGDHMVQHVLLPVNIHVHFLIFNDFFLLKGIQFFLIPFIELHTTL